MTRYSQVFNTQKNKPSTGTTNNGYSPTTYESPTPGGSVSSFYGSLIDDYGHPSQLFCRMSDALFFYIDQNSEPANLRRTGLIEPEKMKWYNVVIHGETPEDFQLYIDADGLRDYYAFSAPSYQTMNIRGRPTPVLNRSSWLQMSVFGARACPDEMKDALEKVITRFRLVDPLTHQPFPLPIPRSALPSSADPTLANELQRHREGLLTRYIESLYAKKYGSSAAFGAAGLGAGSFATSAYNPYSEIFSQALQQQQNAYAGMYANIFKQNQDYYSNLTNMYSNMLGGNGGYGASAFGGAGAFGGGNAFGGGGGGFDASSIVTSLITGGLGGGGGGGGSLSSLLGTATQLFMGGGLGF